MGQGQFVSLALLIILYGSVNMIYTVAYRCKCPKPPAQPGAQP